LKVQLINGIGEIDFRLSEGANERIQLEALVAEFVLLGRAPYLGLLDLPADGDRDVAERALAATGVASLRHRPVPALSGGELSRVAIAKLILSGANVLLLDEPTNHLDIASRETIEAALEAFPGTILIVSHDRQLIDRFADKLVVIENGAATIHIGNYTHYRWKQQAQAAPGAGTGPLPSGQGDKSTADVLRIREKKPARGKSEFRRQESESRKKRKQIEDLERNIESVEEMVQKLEARFPALDPADYAKVSALNEEYDSLKEDLKGMYAEWERLAGE
jgi:ATP-binding cassette subfamily F protein 3